MQQLQIIEQRELLGKHFKIYGDFQNPLFLAKDVANWIEHSSARMMLQSVDEDEKVVRNAYTLGGNQSMWFLTEDGLYEVLMQSRKPIAKEFKKQVKEILKSIRKTGSYTLEQKQEERYEYFDKMFNGVPVVSMLDITELTGINRSTVNNYIRNSDLICGIDYYLAEGRPLFEMKKKYPQMSMRIVRLLLFTKSGFDKIVKACKVKVEPVKCFDKTKKSEPINDMHGLIDNALEELGALQTVIKKLNRYNTAAEQNLFKNEIINLERSVSQKLVLISQVDMQKVTGELLVAEIDKPKFLESKQCSFLNEPLALFCSKDGNTTAAILK